MTAWTSRRCKGARDNEAYWRERGEKLEAKTHKGAVKTAKQIKQSFEKVEKELNKRLKEAVVEMTTQGKLHYKYERLIGIKMDIRNINKRAFTEEEKTIFAHLKKAYEERVMGIGKTFEEAFSEKIVSGAIDTAKINAILNTSWSSDDLNLSKRIWKRGEQVSQAVMGELTRCTVLGLPPEAGVKRLERMVNKECKNASAHAATLLRTESARIASIAEKDAYDVLGVEKYKISATLDGKTSEICQEMDGKVFDAKDMEPGINAPPFHPNCRSTTVPYFKDYTVPERAARDPLTGKTYTEENLPYKEWKKKWEEKFSPKPIQSNLRVNVVQKVANKLSQRKTQKQQRQEEERRLKAIGFDSVEKKWYNLNEEFREVCIDQLEHLDQQYGAFRQGRNTITTNRKKKAKASVRAYYTSMEDKTLAFSTQTFKDLQDSIEKLEDEITAGFKMPILQTRENMLRYTITHEYGHAVQYNLIHRDMLKHHPHFIRQQKYSNAANIEADKYAAKVKQEILAIAKRNNSNFNYDDEISGYGKTDDYEFFAEAFVNAHLGIPNTIGKALLEWLKQQGY